MATWNPKTYHDRCMAMLAAAHPQAASEPLDLRRCALAKLRANRDMVPGADGDPPTLKPGVMLDTAVDAAELDPPDPAMVLEQVDTGVDFSAGGSPIKVRCPNCGIARPPMAIIDMRSFPAIRSPQPGAVAQTFDWACDGCWTHWVRQRWVVATTGRVLAKSEWVAIHADADTDMTTDQRALVDGWLVDQRAREAAEVVPAVVGALARAVVDHQRRQAAGPGGAP